MRFTMLLKKSLPYRIKLYMEEKAAEYKLQQEAEANKNN